jgi:DNA segregation ATPase FtsK/SpoIIIE, S-DNA-T family
VTVLTSVPEESAVNTRRGDLIARIVWGIVNRAVDDAADGQRVTFMLVGLTAEALEGIARTKPRDLQGRTLLLKMNPKAAMGMKIAPEFLSNESAVHWRHNDEADVIVFAPSDAEREGIGAGLGPISRIDEARIIDQISAWVEQLGETGEAVAYLQAALAGLRDARDVCLDLQMWVDFVCDIVDQAFAYAVDVRIRNAMPTLRIPRDGVVKLPAFKPEGNAKARARDFAAAFRDARLEAGVYATLMTPKHERVDVATVRARVDSYDHGGELDVIDALAAVKALLDDAPNVMPGGWRPSQEAFCRKVSWERIGARLFAGGRNASTESLGKQTLRFLEGNYGHDVTKEDRELLESLSVNAPREPREGEVEFFNRWQERLMREVKLFKPWQKRLFSKEVIGQDLLSAFAEGFQALLIASDTALVDMVEPRILVRATQHNKASFWQSLDSTVYRLFLFELRSLKGLFGAHVVWDLAAAEKHPGEGDSSASEARRIELELYLVEAGRLPRDGLAKNPPNDVPRVRTIWQPGESAKDEPISLALPDDIEALSKAAEAGDSLFRHLHFAPRVSGDDARLASTSLADRYSFSDVAQEQDGRTFDHAIRPSDDSLQEIRTRLNDLERKRMLPSDVARSVRGAVDDFEASYRSAVRLLASDTVAAFASSILMDQAEAFGALCLACRLPASTGPTGREIRQLAASIGIVASDGAQPMAILTAWHPLRLAERRAKIRDFADFVDAVLISRPARRADLSTAFQEHSQARPRWTFPEVAFVHGTTMIAVEDHAGYSLMVPADTVARNEEALEASASIAAGRFLEAVDEYLEIHPHEATNLSVAILDSESQTLPREVAREMAKRLHKHADLRCDLVIAHRDQERMRMIYRNQNTTLAAQNISETARGFLSRLRVDVRSNPTSGAGAGAVRDVDLVLLHDVISHHAKPTWVEEMPNSQGLETTFDVSMVRQPRRRMTGPDSSGVGMYLTLPMPPRAVGHYQDLLYEIAKGFLPEDSHGVLIRQIQFTDAAVRDLIDRAHQLGEWVITYDKVASRTLLERCRVEIISDVSLPGADGRVIISAGKVSDRLKRNVSDEVLRSLGIGREDADRLADVIVRDVLKVSGQKVLSAARHANASREMIGLAVMRTWIESALIGTSDAKPIWVSLDDYRGWFMSEKGRVADAVAVTVDHADGAFRLLLQVGEAKFVEQTAEQVTINEALEQVAATAKRLIDLFVDNDDTISRAAACARLADLLVNRDGLAERMPDPAQRAAFVKALSAGAVTFAVSGEAVVCLHDAHCPARAAQVDTKLPYLRHHVLTTPVIRQTLQNVSSDEPAYREGLSAIVWYSQGNGEDTSPLAQLANAAQVVAEREIVLPSGQLQESFAAPPEHEVPAPVDAILAQDGGHVQTDAWDEGAPRFIPPPVYAVLRDMVAVERGAVTDHESLEWARQVARDTQRALSHFGMEASYAELEPRLTPNGALIAFRGHPTLTLEKIERRKSELLTTYGIDVADVQPGRQRISVFVKRDQRAKVPLASTWLRADWPDREPGAGTSFIVGAREDEDRLLYLNIAEPFADYEQHGPHTLIAGETGSGKGILTQGILLQLIAFNDPAQVDLIVIDPKKGVDFGWLTGAPQLKAPIVTEIQAAKVIFEDLVGEMNVRYSRFAAVGARDITEYNLKVPPQQRVSRIFLVHDELGAWMAQEKEYRDVVLSAVSNLGMQARAAGIHLTLITQRADVDAVPGRLRDNMGNRLCLKVQNGTGSTMVLGVTGAEKLLGKGHLACVLANQPPPSGQEFFIVQVPYADSTDIERLAQAAKGYWLGRGS